jgi:hypothetical protein
LQRQPLQYRSPEAQIGGRRSRDLIILTIPCAIDLVLFVALFLRPIQLLHDNTFGMILLVMWVISNACAIAGMIVACRATPQRWVPGVLFLLFLLINLFAFCVAGSGGA